MMMKAHMLASLSLFATTALAHNRTAVPEGCYRIPGHFHTLQDALDALDPTNRTNHCFYLGAGRHSEARIPNLNASLTIYGETEDDKSYHGNVAEIRGGLPSEEFEYSDTIALNETAALFVNTTGGFRMYNVDVVNPRGMAMTSNSGSGFYGCRFSGSSYTVQAASNEQLYINSMFEGSGELISGDEGRAWFENCDFQCDNSSSLYPAFITAHGRKDFKTKSLFVINRGNITSTTKDKDEGDGYCYLGRPKGRYAVVAFQHTTMSDVIHPSGWRLGEGDNRDTSKVYFAEFRSHGAGTHGKGQRAQMGKFPSGTIDIGRVVDAYLYPPWFDKPYYKGKGAEIGKSVRKEVKNKKKNGN